MLQESNANQSMQYRKYFFAFSFFEAVPDARACPRRCCQARLLRRFHEQECGQWSFLHVLSRRQTPNAAPQTDKCKGCYSPNVIVKATEKFNFEVVLVDLKTKKGIRYTALTNPHDRRL